MNSIIFLDIDGVINNDKDYFYYRPITSDRRNKDDLRQLINPILIERVNKIAASAKADVVISSSWRLVFEIDFITELLIEQGATFKILGSTQNFDRWEAIYEYVNKNNVNKYVILDDENLEGYPEYLKSLGDTQFDDWHYDQGPMKRHSNCLKMVQSLLPRFVRTSPITGITDKNVEKAIEILL